MDIVPILSTIILIATIITLIVAIASYMTFRVKEKRKQAAMAEFHEVFYEEIRTPTDNSETLTAVEPARLGSTPPAPVQAPPAITMEASAPVGAPPVHTPAPTTAAAVHPPMIAAEPYGTLAPFNPSQPQGYEPPASPPASPHISVPAAPPSAGTSQYPTPAQPSDMPPPPASRYSGAQAAFVQSFGEPPQSGYPPPQPDGQRGAMRLFTPPENRPPRKETPEGYQDDNPSWK